MSRDSLSGNDTTIERYDSGASGLRGLPGDLLVVVAYAAVAGGLVGVVGGLPTLVRFVLGVPLLMVLPGYALVAALFPGRPSRTADRSSSLSRLSQRFDSARSIQERGIRWGERVALSFGVSLFVAPLLALALDLGATLLGTGSPYRTGPIVGLLVGFTLLFAVAGIVRRLSLPRSERFSVPVGYWIDDFADGLSGSPADALLNVVLVLSILVAAASMSYALAVPKDGATGTNVALMSEGGNGQLVEYNGTVTLTTGEESEPITLVVENHEGEPTNYTVVVQLQRLNDAGRVVGVSEVRRLESPTVPANRTWQRQHTVVPNVSGDRLQLEYLVYRGDPPQNPTERNAYRSPAPHLSVDIVAGGGVAGTGGGAADGSSGGASNTSASVGNASAADDSASGGGGG